MNCIFAEKVSELIDGELPASELRSVERHLLGCRECQQVRADFMNLRSEISNYDLRPAQPMPPRLAQEVSPPNLSSWTRFVGAFGSRSLNPALATGAAVLLLASVLALVLLLRSEHRDPATAHLAQNQANSNSAATASPAPTQAASPDPQAPRKESNREAGKPDQSPPKFQRREAVTILQNGNSSSGRQPLKSGSLAIAARTGTGEIADTSDTSPARIDAADTETLTARHVEQSELLLRSFRNLRPKSSSGGDLGYERRRAQQLFYQNVMLRREADSAGDVEKATLLESLEPILLDIANLPERAPGSEVRAIKDRVERQNLVALLQINSQSQ